MHFLEKSDGFTLVEVIISIALLSVASVVALQLFITSQDMNNDSRHADIASVQATNIIEELRAYDDTVTMSANIKNMKATEKGYSTDIYYNTNFDALDTTLAPSDGIYLLTCQLTESQQGLYEVIVTIKVVESDKELVSYTTDHYFKGEVSSDDL